MPKVKLKFYTPFKAMIIKKLIVGELETNCYILGDESSKEGIVIDPGGDFKLIEKALKEFCRSVRS